MRAIVRKRLRAAIGFVAAGAAIGAVVGLLIHQAAHSLTYHAVWPRGSRLASSWGSARSGSS